MKRLLGHAILFCLLVFAFAPLAHVTPHSIFFKRTSDLSRYLDTVELGPKENAEFQIEILEEVIPAAFSPLTVEFESTHCRSKFTVTFAFK
jgi:hypothetical protein